MKNWINKKKNKVHVPLDVPSGAKKIYIKNYLKATLQTDKLFLFAGDQKMEHLNKDFYGKEIPLESATPKHLFEIANKARIGAFATQIGLISMYGADYKNINYIVKLNSKTNLVSEKESDPISRELITINDVIEFLEETDLSIVGVGYTVYLGSKYEAEMLKEAAQIVLQAHKNGLLVILWMYPKGKSIKNERDAELIAGAAGVGACLGADFLKINPPYAKNILKEAKLLEQATLAAGKSKVICSGGQTKDEESFLYELFQQIHIGGTCGCAIGRNIHQKKLQDAIKFCNAVSAIVIDDLDIVQAKKYLN